MRDFFFGAIRAKKTPNLVRAVSEKNILTRPSGTVSPKINFQALLYKHKLEVTPTLLLRIFFSELYNKKHLTWSMPFFLKNRAGTASSKIRF
jgi:hypothetical protein